MEGRSSREWIWWGRELQVLQREESPDDGERSQRETEKKNERMHMGLHKKNASPKLLAGKRRGADHRKFL